MLINNVDYFLTQYAPAERDDIENVKKQYKEIINIPFLNTLMNSIAEGFLILNDKRQIIFANNLALNQVGANDIKEILGKRPGEALNCENSKINPAGCGTYEKCEFCGAVNAILSSINDIEDIKDCNINTIDGNSMNLKIWTKPFYYNNKLYVFFAMQDISAEKRKMALQRIFFHDIINTVGGISGLIKFINAQPDEAKDLLQIISRQLDFAIDEIQAQKDLIAAENNELKIRENIISSIDLINSIVETYSNHPVANSKMIYINEDTEDLTIESDYILLRRVLGNMLKNALEASVDGQKVTISCNKVNETAIFKVHNETYMPREVQMQIFQRSFSTKGEGRGLGTYSMKLLTTKYLKGKIYFSTSEQDGTTFYLNIPLSIKVS